MVAVKGHALEPCVLLGAERILVAREEELLAIWALLGSRGGFVLEDDQLEPGPVALVLLADEALVVRLRAQLDAANPTNRPVAKRLGL